MTMITIVVRPAPPDRRCRPDREEIFDAFADGRHLCRSKQPFLDGCRALLKLDYPPDAPVQMRHVGSDTISLRSTLAAAAALSVVERTGRRPGFQKYRERFPAGPGDQKGGC